MRDTSRSTPTFAFLIEDEVVSQARLSECDILPCDFRLGFVTQYQTCAKGDDILLPVHMNVLQILD